MKKFGTFLPLLLAMSPVRPVAAQLANVEVVNYPGASGTLAYAINDARDVVGHYRDAQARWHGFLLHAGTFSSIDVPEASQTTVYGVNDSGDVAGAWYDAAGKQHGFLRHHGTFQTIDVPGAAQTMVYGLNAAGDVTGMFFARGDSVKHYGFVMANGRFTTLDHPLPNTMSCGTWLGESGEVGGHVQETNGAYHGYTWKDGEFTLVRMPDGNKGQYWDGIYGMNATGDLLGTYSDATGTQRGFLRRGNVFTTFAMPGAKRTRATGMNRSGQLVGMFVDSLGVTHGFVARLASPTGG